jgi:hypothetical protein
MPAAALGGWGAHATWLRVWRWDLQCTYKLNFKVLKHTDTGFWVIPQPGVVEWTFMWLLRYRRHCCADAVLTAKSKAML